jgi:hypothetical protein
MASIEFDTVPAHGAIIPHLSGLDIFFVPVEGAALSAP